MWTDRRLRTAVLVVSLLLNVFLVGVIAGRLGLGVGAGHLGRAQKRGELPVVPLVNLKALPQDQRKLFRSTMESHRDAIRAARQDSRRRKLTAEADIATEPFDASKVAADLTALREANMAIQTVTNAALIEALGKLSPAARATVVNGEFRDSMPAK